MVEETRFVVDVDRSPDGTFSGVRVREVGPEYVAQVRVERHARRSYVPVLAPADPARGLPEVLDVECACGRASCEEWRDGRG